MFRVVIGVGVGDVADVLIAAAAAAVAAVEERVAGGVGSMMVVQQVVMQLNPGIRDVAASLGAIELVFAVSRRRRLEVVVLLRWMSEIGELVRVA